MRTRFAAQRFSESAEDVELPENLRSVRRRSGGLAVRRHDRARVTPRYAGVWTIARTIVDHDASPAIQCTGSAILHLVGTTIHYDEDVRFELGGKRIRATRSYRFTTTKNTIVASFVDGAPFFELTIGNDGTGMARHDCGPDIYTLTLALRSDRDWQTHWAVRGTKRLEIISRYAR